MWKTTKLKTLSQKINGGHMPKNTWNYRVMIDDNSGKKIPTYSIHEVYYHEDGSPED